VDITFPEQGTFEIPELVEAEQGVVAGTTEML
jgi:hypothetical protein